MKKNTGPKVLILDIETAPMLGYVWSLWENNVALNQLKSDWFILSWAAKWADNSKVMYMDQRNSKNIENDKKLCQGIWKLLDEADIVIGQNSKKFDIKKLNARFLFHNMKPPSGYKQIDTKVIASKNFALSSNSLEYMTKHLDTKYKKLVGRKNFPGFLLWTECLKGNKAAFKEMEKYNKFDVLSTEKLYQKLAPWDSSINFSLYNDSEEHVCSCGSTSFKKNGFAYTSTGRFQRYVCSSCGKEFRGRVNLLSKEKRQSLKMGTR